MKGISLMRGSTGLNTVDDPTRIAYSKSGISDLAEAVNIDLSVSGRINRRAGKTLKAPIKAHSLFCDGGDCVFVHDAGLYLLGNDYSYRLLKTLSADDRMAYVQVGNRIYFTNNRDKGYVEEGKAYEWEKTTDYVGPTTQRVLTGPFPGNHLAYHGGRMYISTDNILWYSEYTALDWYDMARNFIPFNTHIRMIRSVEGGLFVSTSKKIYFLEGLTPKDFVLRTKTAYPALEWSDAIDCINGADIPKFQIEGLCILFVTPEGAVMGTPAGNIFNLNKKKVVYPKGIKGCSLLKGLNFIHTIEG